MRTEKQLAASRANGAKSQGPTTSEGKATSSVNALKSGLYAKNNVITGEDPAEFEALVKDYYQTLRPAGADQEDLVDTLIRTQWLLNRLQNIETRLWEHEMKEAEKRKAEYRRPDDDTFLEAFNNSRERAKLLQRRLDSAHRTLQRTRELLLKLQKAQKPAPQPEETEPDTPVLGSFPHPAPTPTPEPLLASELYPTTPQNGAASPHE